MDIIKFGDFKAKGNYKNKRQILLKSTNRPAREYLLSLKNRFDGNNFNIPHYVVTREGKILKLLENLTYSTLFIDSKINKRSIVIALENLGPLKINYVRNSYINYFGDIYNLEVLDKKWRDEQYWQPYTEKQYESLNFLINTIIEQTNIPNKMVGHNIIDDEIDRFKGIVSISNYDSNYREVNPSFNFKKIKI